MGITKLYIRLVTGVFLAAAAVNSIAGEATVPNTFVSGTAARAAEVNENFEALADEITDNDARLDALEASIGSPNTPTPIEVVQQAREINDSVMVGSEMYTITGYDFIRLNDDALYTLEFPASDDDDYSVRVSVTDGLLSQAAGSLEESFSFTLNGATALLEQRYVQSQQVFNAILIDNSTLTHTVSIQADPKTLVRLSFLYSLSGQPPLTAAEREALVQRTISLLPYLEIRPAN